MIAGTLMAMAVARTLEVHAPEAVALMVGVPTSESAGVPTLREAMQLCIELRSPASAMEVTLPTVWMGSTVGQGAATWLPVASWTRVVVPSSSEAVGMATLSARGR